MEDDPRELVNVRLRHTSIEKIDREASKLDWTRSQMLRVVFALGMRAWERGERP